MPKLANKGLCKNFTGRVADRLEDLGDALCSARVAERAAVRCIHSRHVLHKPHNFENHPEVATGSTSTPVGD